MDITERIKDIIDSLEEAISYEDFSAVDDARKELMFVLQDLESDYPRDFEEEY
jgi:hypothetical protein